MISSIPQDSPPVALTIAGSDSSAGAGLQADLKTFAAHRVYGLSVATSVVAEIPGNVVAWETVTPDLLSQQLDVLADGFSVGAAKTGMLATPVLVERVIGFLEQTEQDFPLVVDPVMVASSGDRLLVEEAVALYRERLLPKAALATPNLAETAVLLDRDVDSVASLRMAEAAKEFSERYQCPVLIKGGHWQSGEEAVDLLWDGQTEYRFSARRLVGIDTHGTGCTLSAAIAANLALLHSLEDSVSRAKRYITAALEQAHRWEERGGIRALNHFPDGVG